MAKGRTLDRLKGLVGRSGAKKDQNASQVLQNGLKVPSSEEVVFKLNLNKELPEIEKPADTPAKKLKTLLEKQGLKVKYERAYHTHVSISRQDPDKTANITFRIGGEMSENDAAQIEHKVNIELLGK